MQIEFLPRKRISKKAESLLKNKWHTPFSLQSCSQLANARQLIPTCTRVKGTVILQLMQMREEAWPNRQLSGGFGVFTYSLRRPQLIESLPLKASKGCHHDIVRLRGEQECLCRWVVNLGNDRYRNQSVLLRNVVPVNT